MRLIVFDQWDKLAAKMSEVAKEAASETSHEDLVTVISGPGGWKLLDHAMNAVLLDQDAALVLPDPVPGKAREFLVHVEAAGDHTLSFEGAERMLAGEEGVLDPPGDGETVEYFFTEVKAGKFLVARKKVSEL